MNHLPKIYVGGQAGYPGEYGKRLAEITSNKDLFDTDKSQARFLDAVDKNENGEISNEEAKEALKVLDRYLKPEIKTLTEDMVKEIVQDLKSFYTTSDDPLFGLEKAGYVYDVTSKGKKFQIVIITKDKLDELKIDLNTIFEKQKRTEFDVNRRYLTNLSTPQTVALGEILEQKLPQLKGKLGLVNFGKEHNEGLVAEVTTILHQTKMSTELGIETFKHYYSRTQDGKPFTRGAAIVKLETVRATFSGAMPSSGDHSSRAAVIFAIEVPPKK